MVIRNSSPKRLAVVQWIERVPTKRFFCDKIRVIQLGVIVGGREVIENDMQVVKNFYASFKGKKTLISFNHHTVTLAFA